MGLELDAADTARLRNTIAGALRMLLALVFGIGFGLVAGGAAQFALGRHSEEIAVVVGLASGFGSAAAMATILAAHRLTALGKFFVSLLLAAGFGCGVAAALMLAGFRGYQGEKTILLGGFGAGFLAAGALITHRLYTISGLAWRFFPPLFLGAGCGMISGCLIDAIAGGSTDDAVLMGAGVGILVFGLTAAMLFLGYFSPARAEARSVRRDRETQVWSGETSNGETPVPGTLWQMSSRATLLVLLAVALGLIPATLHVVRSNFPAVDQEDWSIGPAARGNSYDRGTATRDVERAATEASLTPPSFLADHTSGRCFHSGCTQPAKLTVSWAEPASNMGYGHYCDTHGRSKAAEKYAAGKRFAIFNVNAGTPRHDLEQAISKNH